MQNVGFELVAQAPSSPVASCSRCDSFAVFKISAGDKYNCCLWTGRRWWHFDAALWKTAICPQWFVPCTNSESVHTGKCYEPLVVIEIDVHVVNSW